MARLVYPKISPNIGSSADGLGSYFSSGGEYPTDTIDYIKFTEIEINYSGGGGLSSITPAGKDNVKDLETCYLYIPQNIGTDYGVQYNQVNMGALGVEAASVIGTKSEQEITTALQAAAGSAVPEAVFNTIGTGIGAANNIFGIGGGPSGSALSAIGQGLAFNPFMEQIFEGVGFRNHNFTFKLIARNADEARDIQAIIKFFKMAMLPNTSAGPASGPGSTGTAAAGADPNTTFSGRSVNSRYLKVPNRFKLEFVRKKVDTLSGGITSKDISAIQGLYAFKQCALTNMQVSYTPDGQYVSTDDLYVPAVQLDLRFVELSIITSEDVKSGNY
jgi:hypothetical protein